MFYFLYLCILIDSCLIQSGVSIPFTNNTYFLHFVWLVFVFSDFFGWFVFHFTNILQCVINNLTTVSPVYSQDFVVHQRSDSLIFLFYSETDPDLSGVMGLISELKPEQHNLHLWRHNLSTCREQWHNVNCSSSVCSLLLTLVSEQERRYCISRPKYFSSPAGLQLISLLASLIN